MGLVGPRPVVAKLKDVVVHSPKNLPGLLEHDDHIFEGIDFAHFQGAVNQRGAGVRQRADVKQAVIGHLLGQRLQVGERIDRGEVRLRDDVGH